MTSQVQCAWNGSEDKTALERGPRMLRVAVCAGLFAGGIGIQSGQLSRIWEVVGEHDADGFGTSLARIPDCNNDGIPDIVAGAANPLWESPLLTVTGDGPKGSSGYCSVLSGSDGKAIKQLRPESESIQFGHELCAITSGAPPNQFLIVGAPEMPGIGQLLVGSAAGSGAVHVFSLPALERIAVHEQTGEGQFGYSVAGLGQDLDGDGAEDLLVGAPSASDATGKVLVVSTKSGAVLKSIRPKQDSPSFGWSVSAAPDCNGDGKPEFVIGAPDDCGKKEFAGHVIMYSGRTMTPLWAEFGGDEYEYFGAQLELWNDYDGDRLPDILVSATGDDTKGDNAGKIVLLSSKTGQEVASLYGEPSEQSFGQTIDCSVDLDGCGQRDALVSSSRVEGGYGAGNIRVFSGADRQASVTVPGMRGVGIDNAGDGTQVGILSSSVRFSADDGTPQEFRRGKVCLWRIDHK